jgi:hypothetical protein
LIFLTNILMVALRFGIAADMMVSSSQVRASRSSGPGLISAPAVLDCSMLANWGASSI